MNRVTQQTHIFIPVLLFVAMVCWNGFIGGILSAEAASSIPVLVLTVKNMDDEPVITAVNDEPVKLGWYIDGPVTNCVIIQDNSLLGQTTLVTVDTSILPQTGSMVVTPLTDSTTRYVLDCDAIVEEVPVNTDPPIVTMSINEGTELANNALTGYVDTAIIRWSSINATRCSYISRTSASVSVVETSSADYANRLGTSGWIRYDGNPREIHETTTFEVTCYNDNTLAEDTATLTVNVSNPPAPGAPIVTVGSSNYPAVQRDPLYGYATVDVWYTSNNVTSCSRRAYYEDGITAYSLSPWSNSGTSQTLFSYTNIALATTTVFEVTCSRGTVTLNGITYPATSSVDKVMIRVDMPGGVGDVNTWDRTTLQPVIAEVSVDPSVTTKNALTGRAPTDATVHRENASYCYLKAYQFSALNGTYNNEYSLSNWTRTLNGNGTTTLALQVATTTRLVADCWRDYDRNFGDAAEIENGHEVAEVMLFVNEPTEAAPAPQLYLYGNAVQYSVSQLWSIASDVVGYNALVGSSPRYLENSIAATSSNQISFPFAHPFDAEDDYDIWITLCDEADGESEFRLYVEGTLVGQYITNGTGVTGTSCVSGQDTVLLKRLAQDIEIADGDTVTIACDTPNDGEACRFSDIRFGASGTISTPQVNPVVTSQNVNVMVIAENATFCGNDGSHPAFGHTGYRAADMSVFNWFSGRSALYYDNSGHTSTFLAYPIATTSKLTLGCWRGGDNLSDQEVLNIFVPYRTTLSAETSIGVGECIDDGTFGSFGSSIEAPSGYGPDDDGWCSPMVDLAAENPAVSIAGSVEDNVNGTYKNLQTLMVIKNLGPGELESGNAISYMATMQLMLAHSLPDMSTTIGYFNGGLVAPPDFTSPTQSPTLTRSFDGVPFGTHTVCSRVNLDGSPNFPESSTDYTNNIGCTTVTLPVPQPPMVLSADQLLIRRNQSAVITWGVNVTYHLDCHVQGPGGLNQLFNTLTTGPEYIDSFTTSRLSATGEYMFTCTEPITNTSFNKKIRVEMVPDVEEI